MIVCAARVPGRIPVPRLVPRASCGPPARRQELLAAIADRKRTVPDQWQVQIQAGIQSRARVIVHTSFLSDDELAEAHLEQTHDIAATVAEALEAAGPTGRVCVLPEGPADDPVHRLTDAPRRGARQVPRHAERARGGRGDRGGRRSGRAGSARSSRSPTAAKATLDALGGGNRTHRGHGTSRRARGGGLAPRRRARRDRDGTRLRSHARRRQRRKRPAARLDHEGPAS